VFKQPAVVAHGQPLMQPVHLSADLVQHPVEFRLLLRGHLSPLDLLPRDPRPIVQPQTVHVELDHRLSLITSKFRRMTRSASTEACTVSHTTIEAQTKIPPFHPRPGFVSPCELLSQHEASVFRWC
jgi:hypothetical protein